MDQTPPNVTSRPFQKACSIVCGTNLLKGNYPASLSIDLKITGQGLSARVTNCYFMFP